MFTEKKRIKGGKVWGVWPVQRDLRNTKGGVYSIISMRLWGKSSGRGRTPRITLGKREKEGYSPWGGKGSLDLERGTQIKIEKDRSGTGL